MLSCTGLRVYGKPVTSSAPSSRSTADGAIGLPLNVEPPPVVVPANDQPSAGASTTPSTGRRSIAQPERHREERHAVREVGRAVQRIDVPDALSGAPDVTGRAVVPSSATIAIVGERRRQPLDDQRLGALVVLGDEVDVLGLEADAGRVPTPPSRSAPPRARSRRRSRAFERRRADRAATS